MKRDGVTVAGSGTVAIDADLRVGALEETVTVTGEAPVVDTQSITQQRVLNSDMVDALPSARNYFGLARMIPGTLGGGNDVGGSLIQDVGQSVIVHGSRNVDQRVTVNGVSTMTLQAGGNIGGQTPDVGSASEVTVDTNSLSADLATGGVRINFVPKDGGNRFSNSTFLTFANESLQGDNFSDELRAAGLGTPNKLVNAFDLNESLGGPFKQNKVWFWFSARYNTTENEVPVFANKYAYDPVELLALRARPATPGVNKGTQVNSSIRVTWQASPRNKIAGTYKADKWCNCPNNISATVSPEAGRDRRFPRLMQEHAEWTSPINNHILLEAVGLHLFERWGNMHYRVNDGSLDDPGDRAGAAADVRHPRAGRPLCRPELRHPVELQQHRGAELQLSRGDVVRDRIARDQVRLQPHARLSGREPVHAQPGGLPLQQRRPEPDHRARDVSRQDQPRQRPGLLRAGPLDRRAAGRCRARCASTTSRPASPSSTSGRSRLRRTATSPSRRRTSSRGRT